MPLRLLFSIIIFTLRFSPSAYKIKNLKLLYHIRLNLSILITDIIIGLHFIFRQSFTEIQIHRGRAMHAPTMDFNVLRRSDSLFARF